MTSRSETYGGEVDEAGKRITFDDPALVYAHLAEFAGKRVSVTLGRERRTRTMKQLAWWRMSVRRLAEEAGYDREEVDLLHYQLLVECFGTKFDERLQMKVPNVLHLSDTDTVECATAIDWLPRFAAKHWGIELPLPQEIV